MDNTLSNHTIRLYSRKIQCTWTTHNPITRSERTLGIYNVHGQHTIRSHNPNVFQEDTMYMDNTHSDHTINTVPLSPLSDVLAQPQWNFGQTTVNRSEVNLLDSSKNSGKVLLVSGHF